MFQNVPPVGCSLRRGFSRFVGQVALCLLFGAALSSSVWAAPKAARFALDTKPSGAMMRLLDSKGKEVAKGKTPFIGVIPFGRYRLILEHSGYYQESRTISFQDAQAKILSITLMAKAAKAKTTPTPVRKVTPRKIPPKRRAAERTVPKRKAPPVRRAKEGVENPMLHRRTPPKKKKSKKKAKKKTGRQISWITVIAAGGLGVAGGIVFGLYQSKLSASQDKNSTQVDAYTSFREAGSYRSISLFLFAAAGAAAAISVFLYFRGPSKGKGRRNGIDRVPIMGRVSPALTTQHAKIVLFSSSE